MRIGIFSDTYTPDINGVVSSVVTLQKGLEAQGHEVYVVTTHKAVLHSSREGNVFFMPGVELKKLYGYILSTPYHFTIKSEIAKLNLDVIHVHTEFGVGIFGRKVAKSLEIPVVCTYHTMYEDYTNYINIMNLDIMEPMSKKIMIRFSKYMCESVENIISPSEKTKEVLESYGIKRPIHIIPTGLNLELFSAKQDPSEIAALKQKYNIKEDQIVITYLGRIAPEKSVEFIIEGMAEVDNEKVILMIVGSGPSVDDLKKLVNQKKLQDRVIFVGKVSKEEVPKYYAMSDAFASASTSETQGLTFIEALASGLPLFTRKDECVEELVIEDETGYYVETPSEFASKVSAFAQDKDSKLAHMRANCLQKVQRYDVNHFVEEILKVYNKAIEDFSFSYTIESIRTSKDNVRLYLTNRTLGESELLISLDNYLDLQLKKGDLIELFEYRQLKDKERILIVKQAAIKFLRAKDRTRKEVYDYLIQLETPIEISEANAIVSELESKGYINDHGYAMTQINSMHQKSYGKKKILRKLVEKGIHYKDVNELLEGIKERDEYLGALSLAKKYSTTVKGKSLLTKKQMIVKKLLNEGYTIEIANQVLLELNFDEDRTRESLNLMNAIRKAYKTHSRKHSGKVLENKIFAYCLNRGFDYEDVKKVLEEGAFHEEN